MVSLSKKSVLMLVLLLVVLGGALLVESGVAPETKPATPTFTIQEISQPYDVPSTTTTTVDPYTGEKTTITHPGYHVENKTTYLLIKNQPFTPYKNDNGSTINLYYEYYYRGHYSDGDWTIPYPQYYEQTNSEYTMIPFKGVPSRGQVDIQVRALIGTIIQRVPILGLESSDRLYYSFEGIEGDYSTITLSSDLITSTNLSSSSTPSNGEPSSPETPDTSTTPSTPPTSDPYNPPSQQNPWIINRLIIMVFVAVCIITIPMVIIAYQCGKRKTDSAPYGTKINEKQI